MLLKLILCVGLLLCCITGVMSISSLDVYTDAVDSPFTDTRSSSLTRNPKDATQKHSGSYSYSFIPNLYEAIIFTSSSSISTSAYSSLTFWMYRPTGGSTSISFALVSLSSGFPTKIAFNLPVTIFTNNGWPENQWVQGIVDFSIYNTTNFDGFWFQDTSGLSTNLNKIFFDDIILEIGDPTVATFYNTIQSGQATYYGAYTNGGSCGLDPTPFAGINGIYSTVAIADPQYLGSKACGMCVIFTTTGTGSTSLVFVNNECPSCNPGGLDLGLNGDGIFNITWQATPCPVGTTHSYSISSRTALQTSWSYKQVTQNILCTCLMYLLVDHG